MDKNLDCAKSIDSEAFSHFSMPSNNFINGLRVNHNMGQQKIENNGDMMASMSS